MSRAVHVFVTAAVTAGVAAGVAAALVLVQGGTSAGADPATPAATSRVAPASPHGNRPPTVRLVDRLLGEVRLPSGAQQRSS
ncbi:MAG: hypothetical protein INR67_14975, partial [Jatrophihabitans endophyticus]